MSSNSIFGGDEVGALVFDFGSSSVRAGFAGADIPTLDIPSFIGYFDPPLSNTITATGGESKSKPSLYLGDDSPGLAKAGMQVEPLLVDGLIDNWTYFETAMDALYCRLAVEDSAHCPSLFSEPAWNTLDRRERLTELLFERYNVPALHLEKSPVLSCFAHSRSTGLVLDCGASCMSACPVYEGVLLQQGLLRSPIAGDLVARQCQQLCETEFNVNPIVPAYRVKTKNFVKLGEPPLFTERPGLEKVHPSFHKLKVKHLMQDFVASVLQVSDEPYNDSQSDTFPTLTYEFPNGQKIDVGHDRFRIPEAMFDPAILKESQGNSMLSASHLITSSISLCDVDVRANLANVMVVGGTSLIQGFTERLQRELNSKICQSLRVKLQFNASSWERRFSSWLGGSILGSMGTFHQIWISKQEYEETGKSIVDKKCL